MITLCCQNNFSFSHTNYDITTSASSFKIKGGSNSLESIFEKDYYKHVRSLKKKGILFLEQITSLNGKSLLEWHTLHQKSFVPVIFSISTSAICLIPLIIKDGTCLN